MLGQSTGWDLKLKKDARKATILLTLNPEKVDKLEGYRLDVTPKGISLTGRDAGGIFYGIQTLLQLFPPQVYSDKRQHGVEWIVPAVTIYDAPKSPLARHDAGRGSLFLRQRVREKIHRHDGHVQAKQTAIPLD